MSGRIRVLVWHKAPDAGPELVELAYQRVSAELDGTPGLLRSELLRGRRDPASLLVVSEWESLAAFEAWEQGPGHRPATAPLRPFRDNAPGRSYDIYEVKASS